MPQVAGSISQASPSATPISYFNVRGIFDVRLVKASTATLTNVAGSANSVTILASNDSRLGGMVFNDSNEALYLKLGTTASTTSFTVKVLPGGYFELPGPHVYSGVIDGIWATATGTARVTETT